ncbi:MAG: ATP-binding protein [Candidatus Cloacimonadaceae bacterium]
MYIDHRYEVLESLGRGSWANVYKVRDIRDDNVYTLKLFQYLSSEEFYRYFKPKDMHHITKIEHPNLSKMVDFGNVGDHIYSVSVFFDGITLNSFHFNKSKVNDLYDIIVQICYALDALHTQNILHRDLKLENVLYRTINNKIEVKVIDYGFSRWDLDKEAQTVSGTLPYIAPEIYQGNPATPGSDFYSLGVMLYKLTTGNFPFTLEQINAIRSGSKQYFIPIFPSELNPNIPLHLEKLCLRMLERNPENRFQNSAEIISYINRTSGKKYPFSESWSLINSIKFNSYTVQEKIVNKLLDYLPQLDYSNGKIISLIGGEGIGKASILSLFRYNILRGSYFIFDYTCTRTDHEAFFALIKEYLQSLSPSEIQRYQSMSTMTEQLRRYVFMSEQAAKEITPTKEELKSDFEFCRDVLIELAQSKPVIFIIRDIQYLHHNTIDFINYLSPTVAKYPILIVMSSTDFNKVKQIKHTVLISVPMFTREETRSYIHKLLTPEVSPQFCDIIYERSAGNPYFIREILIDLALKKQIYYEDKLIYPENLEDYVLPSRLLHSIYTRMSHLTEINYKHLQKLSIVQTPISIELIRYICKVKDEELYNLLNESKYNEILEKRGEYYYFTFREAKERFFEESDFKIHKLVSLRVLNYYKNKKVTDITTCKGIILNAQIAQDKIGERKWLLNLFDLLKENYFQEEAYKTIVQVLDIDLSSGLNLASEELSNDLANVQKMIEITGNLQGLDLLDKTEHSITDSYEKYLLLGTIKLLSDNTAEAYRYFTKAEKWAHLASQKGSAILYQAQCYAGKDPLKIKKFLERAAKLELTLALKITYTNLSALYLFYKGQQDLAINTIEDFLALLPPDQDLEVMLNLALLHNELGEFYILQKNVIEAEEHFNLALNIWNKYKVNRYLTRIHNNIADLHLKQGFTVSGLSHSQQALDLAIKRGDYLAQGRALLNQGEAMIKMGKFEEAEVKLIEASQILSSLKAKNYKNIVIRNLALAKSKIIGFGHYYQFISKHEPKLIEGIIQEINPLVKTYFYYLSEISYPAKIKKLLQKNVHLDFELIKEQEFYHNVLSLLAISEKNYKKALEELKLAAQFAGEINNHYAMAVFNVLQAKSYYGLGKYKKAQEIINNARPAIQEYQYKYWEMSLDILELRLELADASIPLRSILRRTINILEECYQNKYYQLIVELKQIKIQTLLELGAIKQAEKEFQDYKQYLDNITSDISPDDRENFLKKNLFGIKNVKYFNLMTVASRKRDVQNQVNDLIFAISNVTTVQQMKFLVEKGITQVLSPWKFKLMVFSEKMNSYYAFLSYNWDPDMMLPAEFSPHIEQSFTSDSLVRFRYQQHNILIIPLLSGTRRIGYLVVSDNGELPYTQSELAIAKSLKSHLASLIIRINDYEEITLRMEKMNQLINISRDLLGILDMNELETGIVTAAIDLIGSTRGFFISKDEAGNNLYKVQMSQNKQILTSTAGISNTALSLCQTNQEPIIAYNAQLDNRFKNAVSVQDYAIQTIFCCPIMVDNLNYGYLYLDNYGDSTREMYLNEDIIKLFLDQVANAIRNAQKYAELLEKSNELNNLEQSKDEFVEIVAHELNTPLTAIQGYVSRLKRKLYSDEEEHQEIIYKLESAVNKLATSIGDITTMNHYNITQSLPKSPLKIEEILDLVQQEVLILSRQRKMQIKLEIEEGLPMVNGNWEALHRMIYNVVLNAIRFTREFGTIVIGARKSAFPQERINNQDSLVIYVKDNGIGIPEYQLKNIYRKFYELNDIYAHKSGTVEYRSSGLGLGLAISKRIAELHNGQIIIKSKENEGTSVFMIIPFK